MRCWHMLDTRLHHITDYLHLPGATDDGLLLQTHIVS